MWWGSVLAPQLGTLSHAEAVLLVDNGKSQILELDSVLNQRVGANEDVQLAAHELLVNLFTLFLAGGTSEQSSLQSHCLRHLANALKVLSGKDFGRCHDACLIAVVGSQEHSHKRYNGLAAAHVALKQAVHLTAAAHVMMHFLDYTFLRSSERELQVVFIEIVEIVAHVSEHMSWNLGVTSLDVLEDVHL